MELIHQLAKCSKDRNFSQGCYDKMKNVIKSHTLAIGLVALFALLFIVFGLILSGTLYLIIGRKAGKTLTGEMNAD